MARSPIQLVFDELIENCISFEEFSFLCVGGRGQGKTTFINNIGVTQRADANGVLIWTFSRVKFYEYSSSSLPLPLSPSPNSNGCVLLFSKFLQEQTQEFENEVRNAKRLAKEYNYPILLIHTFCDQNTFPAPFVTSVCAKIGKGKEEELNEELFKRWRIQKDKAVNAELPSICCAFSYRPTGILPDGTDMYALIVSSLFNILANKRLESELITDPSAQQISDEPENSQLSPDSSEINIDEFTHVNSAGGQVQGTQSRTDGALKIGAAVASAVVLIAAPEIALAAAGIGGVAALSYKADIYNKSAKKFHKLKNKFYSATGTNNA